MESGAVLTIGNPLLDIAVVAPDSLFQKYSVVPATACLADEKHEGLYEEIKKFPDVVYTAGGSAQNTARTISWVLGQPGIVTYVGCIGKDENGKKLREVATQDSVNVQYLEDETNVTGTCAVLIKNHERSLVANLAAASHYKIDHLKSIQEWINKAKVIYGTGFFVTHSFESLIELGNQAIANDKVFMFCLCAEFLINFYTDKIDAIIPYCDYVFANDLEGVAFGKKKGWGEDLKVIAKNLSELPKLNKKRNRTIIFTQGANPAIVYHEGQIKEYPSIQCPKELLVDTNGAGDAFVGAFIAGYIKGKSIDECVQAGHYVACEVIKRSGVAFPEKCSFVFK
eukprot:TRINITY_DN2078_c0_g1_i1.p1 TRINITY_DN2078_c0_g1~~TRINITY_DN2078_c0_g1_i1.p1  ORF type:complete len:340 (-),score=78.46 TRINITY_DN2078_c0_g1_i1:54-1073(-)